MEQEAKANFVDPSSSTVKSSEDINPATDLTKQSVENFVETEVTNSEEKTEDAVEKKEEALEAVVETAIEATTRMVVIQPEPPGVVKSNSSCCG